MSAAPSSDDRIAVIGLGYVGLPLALAFARHFPVVGYDHDPARVAELEAGRDRTGEVDTAALAGSALTLTADAARLDGASIYILAVPTPVDGDNRPDLAAVRAACGVVGAALGPGAVVVLESTVYPGVTEEVCGPVLAAASGLAPGRDFFLGYSPERVNPGDAAHAVEHITKVVAGQTPEVAERLARVYGTVTAGGIFVARDIRTAEAAKVIENAQRDINIAFINEVAMIFRRAGLSVHDVLAAAGTKWNFLPFRPGLVGGHCIGVDPYWLADFAQRLGHEPEVVLAGRRINDAMGGWLAARIGEALAAVGAAGPVLVLGLTFKENVPDTRNSRVAGLVAGLEADGRRVDLHDPLADPAGVRRLYGRPPLADLDAAGGYAAVVGAVPHDAYRALDGAALGRLLVPGGLVADIKGMWRDCVLPPGLRRWEL